MGGERESEGNRYGLLPPCPPHTGQGIGPPFTMSFRPLGQLMGLGKEGLLGNGSGGFAGGEAAPTILRRSWDGPSPAGLPFFGAPSQNPALRSSCKPGSFEEGQPGRGTRLSHSQLPVFLLLIDQETLKDCLVIMVLLGPAGSQGGSLGRTAAGLLPFSYPSVRIASAGGNSTLGSKFPGSGWRFKRALKTKSTPVF